MSSFLGPIHYIMYEKIKFQDKLTAYLLKECSALDELNKKIPPVPTEDLADIVDHDNIHGWLSSKIDVVESRLSYAINAVDNAEELFYEMGEIEAQGYKFSSVEELFQVLNKKLLDGMPCDRGMVFDKDEEESLYLIQQVNVHKAYEENPLSIDPTLSLSKTCAGDDHDHHESFAVQLMKDQLDRVPGTVEVSKFLRCRFAFLKGFVKNTDYKVELLNSKDFKISKKSS